MFFTAAVGGNSHFHLRSLSESCVLAIILAAVFKQWGVGKRDPDTYKGEGG